MAHETFFYRSINGDRTYKAESMAKWLQPFFVTGVFNGHFQVLANGGMSVTVQPGYANIGGKVVVYDAPERLELETASGSLKRIDNIILRRDDQARDIYLTIQKGGLSINPVAPSLMRANGYYDLKLAEVYVEAGAIAITQSKITDTRMNPTVCGWVATAIEQINFQQITAQWDDTFRTWFSDIRGALEGDVAGNLANRINEIAGSFANQLAAKGKQITAWNGSWGAAGSGWIAIPGLNQFAWLVFDSLVGSSFVVPLPTNNTPLTISFNELQTSGNKVSYDMRITRETDVMILSASRYTVITPSGTIVSADNPSNMIVRIGGVV